MSLNNEIFELIKSSQSLSEEDLKNCLEATEKDGLRLDGVLIEKGLITEADVLNLFGEKFGIPFYESLGDFTVPGEFTEKVPLRFARALDIVGLSYSNGTMEVAVRDPGECHALDDIAGMVGARVEPVLATKAEIEKLIARGYQDKSVAEDILEGFTDEEISEDLLSGAEDLLDFAQKAPVIRLASTILLRALRLRASDVHFQPYEDKLQVRYRIDGVLYDMFALPKSMQEEVISRIKVMGRMDIAERRLAQDGRTTVTLGGREIDLRISIVPTSDGERVVLRLLDKGARLYTLEELGLGEIDLKRLQALIHVSHGLLFVTGPTGSGKTTTLYACMGNLNAAERNIISIEDPIEYKLTGISQIQVGYKKGLTFATGLRSVLRQDPDVIVVGEVRDLDTARIAIQSAQTGHLVFSTLHTNDSAGAITRLLDIGIEPYLVASSVIAAMAQRLVRLICKECKVEYEPEEKNLARIGLSLKDVKGGKLWKGTGCPRCLHTGYYGRTGIFELLVIDDEVRKQIMSRAGSSEIKRKAVERGLRTLRMDGASKVLAGLTTVDEVLRVTQMDVS